MIPNKTIWPNAILLVALTLLMSCATIPKAAPDLSLQLGKQIRSMEAAHKNLLTKFFEDKRHEVDKFIQEQWIPVFAKNFFRNQGVSNTLNQVLDGRDTTGLLQFVEISGTAIQEEINSQRTKMMQPLNDLETKISTQLTADYNQAFNINTTITTFLSSAAKVEANTDKYLQILGINSNSIDGFIDKADSVVSGHSNFESGVYVVNFIAGRDQNI